MLGLEKSIPLAMVFGLTACPSLDDEIIVAGTDEVGTDEVGTDAVGTDESSSDGEPEPGDDGPKKTYFIGETMSFSSGGACFNDDLNEVTYSFALEMDDAGWLGIRWNDQQSWPEDFAETTLFPGALDQMYGDASTLTVYAGHGNVGTWQWGTPSGSGACVLSLPSSMRLGTLAGDRSTTLMSLTSCTGRADQLWPTLGQINRVRQILAYHNSPIIWDNQPRDFFRATASGMTNRTAWLTIMANKPGIGHNSPSVMTIADTPEHALEIHGIATLASLEGLTPPSETADGYVYSYLDYGCGPCGCPAQGLAEDPWLDPAVASAEIGDSASGFPTTHPVVQLTRKQRTTTDLVDLVAGILDLAELPWDSAISDWAVAAVATPDEMAVLQLDEAWLTYTPRDDDLSLIIEQATGDLVFDQADASDLFQQIFWEAEARNLIGPLDPHIERVGVLKDGLGTSRGSEEPDRTFAWRFEVSRTHGGFPLLGAGLAAVINVDGRLASIRVSDMNIEHQQWAVATPTPASLRQQWDQALVTHHRKPDAVHVDQTRWAFALDPDQASTLTGPRLVVDYVLGYDAGESRMPSHQSIVALAIADGVSVLLTP